MKPSIEQIFGTRLQRMIRDFASAEIKLPGTSDTSYFRHIKDPAVRRALSDTLYGARWLYKLALALKLTGAELSAHVRAQIIDYVSICEAVIGDMMWQVIGQELAEGRISSSWARGIRVGATQAQVEDVIRKIDFAHRIDIAADIYIVDTMTKEDLHEYREMRNTVHISVRAQTLATFGLSVSKEAYNLMHRVICQSQLWYKRTLDPSFVPLSAAYLLRSGCRAHRRSARL